MTAKPTRGSVALPPEPTSNHAAIREAQEALEGHFHKPWWRVENFNDLKKYLFPLLVASHALQALSHLVAK